MRYPYYGEKTLEHFSQAENLYKWIFNELKTYLHGVVLEIGAGTGNLSSLLLDADIERLILLEPAENLLPTLQEKFERYKNVQIINGYMENLGESTKVDVIVCCSVLEHVEDDKALLMAMYKVLNTKGKVVIFVPAGPWAYGPFDEAVGHFRRYSKEDIIKLVAGTGFCIENCKYTNFLGCIFYTLSQKLLGSRDTSPIIVKFFDRFITSFAVFLEYFFPPPIGLNLFAVLEKG